MKNIFFLSMIVVVILSSCRGFTGGYAEHQLKPVPFKITSQSNLFNENYFTVKIDSGENYLHVKIIGREELHKFPFPKDKKGEALSATAFNFEFLENNKIIEGAKLPLFRSPKDRGNYFGYNNWLTNSISFSSDTIDLASNPTIEFKIPFYALHKLKKGIHELEIRCTQNIFCSASTFKQFYIDSARKDTNYRYIRNYDKSSLLSFNVKFQLRMPAVFKTTLYGMGIELRNDSVFSPVGMDNTIWNSSYPDVYWTINYPDNEFYCSSDYQKSTAMYDIQDTFFIYHYTPYDSIYIGVWDHDNLSRDDYISYKRFSLNQFKQNTHMKLHFQNIKCFDLRAVKEKMVNK